MFQSEQERDTVIFWTLYKSVTTRVPWFSHLLRSVHPQTTMPFCLPGGSLWRRRHCVSLPLHKTHYTKDKLLFIAATQCWFYRGNNKHYSVWGRRMAPSVPFNRAYPSAVKILFQFPTSASSSRRTPELSFITLGQRTTLPALQHPASLHSDNSVQCFHCVQAMFNALHVARWPL